MNEAMGGEPLEAGNMRARPGKNKVRNFTLLFTLISPQPPRKSASNLFFFLMK